MLQTIRVHENIVLFSLSRLYSSIYDLRSPEKQICKQSVFPEETATYITCDDMSDTYFVMKTYCNFYTSTSQFGETVSNIVTFKFTEGATARVKERE